MSATTASATPDTVSDFDRQAANAGLDHLMLSTVIADSAMDAVVQLFQRDYRGGDCRTQLRAIADRYDEFEALNAAVGSVLPEPLERASRWQVANILTFALLAAPITDVSEADGQPVRFGILGSLHDLVGRMVVAMGLDTRSAELGLVFSQEGRRPGGRREIADVFDGIRSLPDA
jgi:peroxiredoxin Q/BCP